MYSALAAAGGSVLGSAVTGMFNARQAAKNRKFQERMSNTAHPDRDWETK